MEELTLAEIDDWLAAHDMVILATTLDQHIDQYSKEAWIYHRDTKRGNWVSWIFLRRITNADAGVWPMEYFS